MQHLAFSAIDHTHPGCRNKNVWLPAARSESHVISPHRNYMGRTPPPSGQFMAIASVRCASAALHSLPHVVEDREVEDDAWEADGEGEIASAERPVFTDSGLGAGLWWLSPDLTSGG